MAHELCMMDHYGYKHTLRICNTYCFPTATVVRRTRLSVRLHVHCLSCSTYRTCWRITDIRLSILVSRSISVFGATKNKLRRTVWEMNAILRRKRKYYIVSEIRCCQCRNRLLRRVSRNLVKQCTEALEETSNAVMIYPAATPRKFLWNSGTYLPNNTASRRRRWFC